MGQVPERGRQMKKHHEIREVRVEGDCLVIKLGDREHRFALADISPRLWSASPQERAKFELSPSGYGIHWPLLDEDLSVDGLLGISHAPPISKGKAA